MQTMTRDFTPLVAFACLLCVVFTALGCTSLTPVAPSNPPPKSNPSSSADATPSVDEHGIATDSAPPKPTAGAAPWLSLVAAPLDKEWKPIVYGGEAESLIDGNEIHLNRGDPLTGLAFRGDLASILPESQEGYQLRFEAKRVDGHDFFCGATFPVGTDGRLTLVLGGWGGGLAGLSSLDGMDASQNDTTSYRRFERDRWYDIEIKVTASHVECSIDGKRLNLVERSLYTKLWVRPEVELSVPLSFSSFSTYGVIRNPRVRSLPETSKSKES